MLSLLFSGRPAVSLDHALDDLPLSAARDAALRGDWEPARTVLSEAAGDWERRAHRCEVLGTVGADHPQWLAAWAAAEPESPDAAVVLARAGVATAWNARGSGWARNTSAAAFDRFHRILADAESAVVRATTLAADDPSPWIWYLWLTIGRGDGRPVFERRWKELLTRDPHNYLGHEARFQFSCRKWSGDHERMYDFCRTAAASAPPGSPLALLPLQAHFEFELIEADRGGEQGAARVAALWDSAEVRADIDTAKQRWLGAGPPEHALAMKSRSVLARALTRAGRFAEAAEQFAAIGPYVSEYPWYYDNGGPRHAFLAARRKARRGR
ncbi:hypothetical protein OHA72_60735 [Dactylosporangium sp. NBC_01737]|uniref:hypothetical protein n=1 Tax=Dactylosporangium sp. NBC_01737 TaxID=2975959 RepID=UPI002E1667AD|nr:hypothetical protein OHA72_60735 [Dactylosporangium sp. NBC_01737]